jgi:adenylate kinase family enzyme
VRQRQEIGRRINVIGTTGSGKTTVARAIAERLGIPHIEMDALFWKPNWGETPDEELFAALDRETDQASWVVDGNYSRTRGIVWPKAETIVWLDYPFFVVFGQLLLRTITRAITREPMWDGCIETWRMAFLSRESILLWCIRTHRRRKRNYPRALAAPEHAHLQLIRLRSRRATRRWLAALPGNAINHA